MLKDTIKKLVPGFIVDWYHFCIAFLAAFVYGFPSRKMIVIGVTGTKGKTTVTNLICHILNQNGFKTGMASTVNFCIGDRIWTNTTRQTMLGRFALQKLLSDMAKEGCRYAVVETSSEGILQHRQRFIDYNVAVFLNLMPEHLDKHGGLENYRGAKLKLFEQVAKKKDGIGIYNLDNEHASFFMKPAIKKKIGYKVEQSSSLDNAINTILLKNIEFLQDRARFKIQDVSFDVNFTGIFNIQNAGAAIATCSVIGVPMNDIAESLKSAYLPSGRMEIIQREPFVVIIDYAYEPNGLEAALQSLALWNPKRILVMTGIAAEGRDIWQRRAMGRVAAKYASIVVATTDDPYNEDPEAIINEVVEGALENENYVLGKNIFPIVDRREAIESIISLAKPGDIVFLGGKGGETAMKVGGKKISWYESEITKEILKNPKRN